MEILIGEDMVLQHEQVNASLSKFQLLLCIHWSVHPESHLKIQATKQRQKSKFKTYFKAKLIKARQYWHRTGHGSMEKKWRVHFVNKTSESGIFKVETKVFYTNGTRTIT